MLSSILGRAASVARRRAHCREHEWTDKAMPPACVHCGRTRLK